MKAQGTDGVSRGQLTEGVMNGKSMFVFLPMHESGLQRFPPLKQWLLEFITPHLTFLSPDEWFTRGHNHHTSQQRKGSFGQSWASYSAQGLLCLVSCSSCGLDSSQRALQGPHKTSALNSHFCMPPSYDARVVEAIEQGGGRCNHCTCGPSCLAQSYV
jgi:hypothetical protein